MKKTFPNYLPITAAFFLVAQVSAQTYNGVPFSQVASGSDPATEWKRTFRSAEITGEKIDFAASNSVSDFALFRSDGGNISTLLDENTVLGSGPASERLEGLFQRVEGGANASLTIEAKVGGVSGYYRRDGSTWTEVMRATQNMPGKTFPYTLLGEPHSGNGKTAFIGINNDEEYRGVYIRDNATGAFTTVADSATNLPGIDSFDSSSSQVGFDGNTVVFWGIHKLTSTTTSSGIFVGNGGALTGLAITGDAISGTSETINSFQSPPAIDDGKVAYVAADSSFKHYVYYWNGSNSILVAKEGDTLPAGGVITALASYPPKLDGGKMVFDAKVDGASAILEYDGTTLREVVRSSALGYTAPSLFIPLDLEGDLMAIHLIQGYTELIFMNQSVPAKPKIAAPTPNSVVVDPGAGVTLAPQILGQGPLTTSWTSPSLSSPVTTPSLTINNFSQADANGYTLRVDNAFGSAFYTVYLSINTAPYFVTEPADVSGYEGSSANLRGTLGGNPDFTYKWFKGSNPTPVSTNGSLYINPLTVADAGTYRLEVTNPLGSVTSRDVVLTVNPIPENPSFGGAQFNSLIADPAATAPGYSGLQTLTADPVSGNILYYETPAGTFSPMLFSVDSSGVKTAIFDPASIGTSLGQSGVSYAFGGVEADGSSLFITRKYSPTRTWIHRFDGTGLTQLLDIQGSIPGLAAFPAETIIPSGNNAGDPIFQALNADGSQVLFFNIVNDTANELFRFTGTLTGDGVTSSGSISLKALNHPDYLAAATETSGTGFERIWLIKRDGSALPIVAQNMTVDGGPVNFASPFVIGATSDGRVIFYDAGTYQWKDGVVTAQVFPATNPPEQLIGTPTVAGGQLFMSGRSGAVYRFTETSTTLIYGTRFFNKVAVTSGPTVVNAFGNEVVLRASVRGKPEQVFVNRGAGSGERLPDIEYTYDPVAETMTITIPTGQTLWSSENLKDWTELTATGTYVVPVAGEKLFFQLRK